jgi:hypothetical protein
LQQFVSTYIERELHNWDNLRKPMSGELEGGGAWEEAPRLTLKRYIELHMKKPRESIEYLIIDNLLAQIQTVFIRNVNPEVCLYPD